MGWILLSAALSGLVIGLKYGVWAVLAASAFALIGYVWRVMAVDMPASEAAVELLALLIVLQMSYLAGAAFASWRSEKRSRGILHAQHSRDRSQQDHEVEAERPAAHIKPVERHAP